MLLNRATSRFGAHFGLLLLLKPRAGVCTLITHQL